MNQRGYCILIDTLCQRAVPSVTEALSRESVSRRCQICLFPTELEAQREIVDGMIIKLQQFLDGERDFDDAVTLEEYIVEVEVLPDGAMVDTLGNKIASID